jgi:hypothetical protein
MTTLDQLYLRIDSIEKQINLFNISISPPTKTELKRAIPDKKAKVVVALPLPSYPEEELVEEPLDHNTDEDISDDSRENNTVETNKKRVSGYTVFQRVMHDEAEQSIYDEIEPSMDTNITQAKPKQYMILKKLAAMWKEIEPDAKNLWKEEATKINANNNKA